MERAKEDRESAEIERESASERARERGSERERERERGRERVPVGDVCHK